LLAEDKCSEPFFYMAFACCVNVYSYTASVRTPHGST